MSTHHPLDDDHTTGESHEESRDEPRRRRVGRRKVLAGLGFGVAAAGAPGVLVGARGGRRGDRDRRQDRRPGPGGAGDGAQAGTGGGAAGPDRFSRIWNDHPPFVEPSDALREVLTEIGRPGGMLDARDPLEVGPVRLITEPELSPRNRDNPTHTAGTTFMGQFIDHDITSDAGSRLGRRQSVQRSTNMRNARLDLDSVYGGGPTESPELYRDDDPLAFGIESGGRFEDLPRDADGAAIVADARNDENMMISGLQAAFLLAHNAILERERAASGGDPAADSIFARAQRRLRWHYQWIVLHELLPQFVGAAMVDDILTNGRRYYTPDVARIPVEFQTSAYRFGHSMIRPSYRANLAGDGGEPFFGFVFDPTQFGVDDPDDLQGGSRAPRRFIGWQTFFDFGDGEVKPNKRIDTTISTPMFQLPLGAIGTPRGEAVGPLSLATRNLMRHITWGIPCGQDIAGTMSVPRLAAEDLADLAALSPRLAATTPLWLYVLREADVVQDGLHLGPVGGRIVGEVLIGLMQLDPDAFLAADPGWRPTLPSRHGPGEFTMADLLTLAGVDPATRGE
jgi:hypothetical protein